ncbi:MAG: O-antigen ligase family protein [Flavobacteriales bacterium]
MTARALDAAEQWAWRLLMPALLYGGVAAAWVLLTAAILRLAHWRLHQSDARWRLPEGGWLWLGYYGLQLAGGMWSANSDAWAFSLEVKASMVFLPLVAGMPGTSIRKAFLWSVVWSVVAYLAGRLALAGWHHGVEGDPGHWRYTGLAGDVHPTYLSLHAAVAWLGLGQTSQSPRVRWALTGMLALSIGLLGSKAGILAAVGVSAAGILLRWMRGPKAGSGEMQVGLSSAFLAILLMTAGLTASGRFQEMRTAAAVVESESAPVSSSSAGRVAVWRSSWELLAEHPFGVGTGDVTDELQTIYERDGIVYAQDRRLNPHNQWLQAGVAFGWPGVLMVTLIVLSWLRRSWRRGQDVMLLCGLLIGAHAMVESVLEVQRGVVFILWMWAALEQPDDSASPSTLETP